MVWRGGVRYGFYIQMRRVKVSEVEEFLVELFPLGEGLRYADYEKIKEKLKEWRERSLDDERRVNDDG